MNHKLIMLIVITAILLSGASSSVIGQGTGTVVINEFLASNNSSRLDPDFSQYSDWIEIYNWGNTTINLGGYYLTDDHSDPLKWQIPGGIVINAGEFLLFWADGSDDTENGIQPTAPKCCSFR